ncbi:mitomycin antibiotics/polyketide fumonisin biosynthesis protein [Mycobacterium sp. EPG1]|nr:mitomycin antibiotics/polyketide fumonisin biosynthesis protein [Mycobacterium sp. EPG1]
MVDTFVADGFVRIPAAVPRGVADAARALLWARLHRDHGLDPDDRGSWTRPVVWTADMTGEGPFGEFCRSPALAAALDDVCGAGAWIPRGALGNIPVRFPVAPPAEDRGWHLDLNTQQPDGTWTVSARPHTVLLLTLLSDVGADDAPTRIRVGSHRDAAAALGDRGLDAVAAAELVEPASRRRPVAHATGSAGDMYVVHPLTVHAADEHRGATPRFMAQAPVLLRNPHRIHEAASR